MATRMAYNLGLNVESDEWLKSGLITEEDSEVRKVAWHGCWTLDKYAHIQSLRLPISDKTLLQALLPPPRPFWNGARPRCDLWQAESQLLGGV
jgi:hypothetical protein